MRNIIVQNLVDIVRNKKIMMCGIYCIRNTVNGKMYFGHSINFNRRIAYHTTRLKNNNHWNPYLQRSFNRHGINVFKVYFCEFKLDKEALKIIEDYYIKRFGVYNLTTLDSETAKYRKEGTYYENRDKTIYQYDCSGKLITVYYNTSCNKLRKELNLTISDKQHIIDSINRGEIYKGCYWSYEDLSKSDRVIKYISQYDKFGKFIKNWILPVTQISIQTNQSRDTIRKCLYKQHLPKQSLYIWKYNHKKFETPFNENDIDAISFIKTFESVLKPVIQYNQEGDIIKYWFHGATDMAKELGVTPSTIYSVLTGTASKNHSLKLKYA